MGVSMILMGKRKPQTPKGRARERGAVRLLGIEIDVALADAFDAFIESRRPRINKRSATEWAIEKLLTEHGHWPPK
jgi:hypothetical protein